jgi:hypothetical protein
MDKIQKPVNSECHSPSSEPFRICSVVPFNIYWMSQNTRSTLEEKDARSFMTYCITYAHGTRYRSTVRSGIALNCRMRVVGHRGTEYICICLCINKDFVIDVPKLWLAGLRGCFQPLVRLAERSLFPQISGIYVFNMKNLPFGKRLPKQIQSYFTIDVLPPICSYWRQAPWGSRPEYFFRATEPLLSQSLCNISLTRGWVCLLWNGFARV